MQGSKRRCRDFFAVSGRFFANASLALPAALPSLPPFSAALSLASASASALSARTGKRVFSRTSSNNWRIGELAASSPETWSAPSPASLNGSRPRRPTASLQKFA